MQKSPARSKVNSVETCFRSLDEDQRAFFAAFEQALEQALEEHLQTALRAVSAATGEIGPALSEHTLQRLALNA